MQPLYTETEFKTAKSRDKLHLRCSQCGCVFHRTKNHIQSILSNPKAIGAVCSATCRNRYIRRGLSREMSCTKCGQPFKKILSQIAKSKSGNHFCSRSCSAIWNNTHKKHGTRCSKLEKWLEEQLTALYPDLGFHFNRTDAIDAELDIFIPSLRLAFELNGIYHYEPIHGQDKLDAVQSNDHRKMIACSERGIDICVIDNSSLKYFKEQRAMKFLKIIQDIIDSRLSGS